MEWDWRNVSGVLSLVRRQTVNCCWAIAAVNAITAAIKIKHPEEELLDLSIQELIDSCRPDETLPYDYSFKKAFQWIKENGLRNEKDYPYTAFKNPMKPKSEEQKKSAVYIADIKKINHQNESEFLEMVRQQPVAGAITVFKEFIDYKRGIYEGPNPNSIMKGKHAVLIIGFGTEQGRNYWLIKNAWGTHWGNGGYAKVARNSSLLDNRKNIIYNTACPIVF